MTDCAVCGDGIRDTLGLFTELCDDGNLVSNDGCNATCQLIENGYDCTLAVPNVCKPICNDGKVVGTETCDDWTANGEGCNPTCNGNVTGWNCTGGGPYATSTCLPVCGDGY